MWFILSGFGPYRFATALKERRGSGFVCPYLDFRRAEGKSGSSVVKCRVRPPAAARSVMLLSRFVQVH